MSEFYSYVKKKTSGQEYIYYRPDCRECSIKNTMKWKKENHEHYSKWNSEYHKTQEYLAKERELSKKPHIKQKRREWRRSNPDRLKEYASKHRIHDITPQEWDSCRNYFNYSCAYCGMSEDDAKEKYGNYLHQEHVDHEGANDLSNCVPSCKGCNSSKNVKQFFEWYKTMDFYDEERLRKILSWLESDYKGYLEQWI